MLMRVKDAFVPKNIDCEFADDFKPGKHERDFTLDYNNGNYKIVSEDCDKKRINVCQIRKNFET